MQDNPILPETGFIRLATVLKFIPIGKTTWWDGIKAGRYPKPVKLSQRVTVWRVEDIRALIQADTSPAESQRVKP